jgi:DNA/RNA-binding domain of Phe-tRNA-synthetase-like protein
MIEIFTSDDFPAAGVAVTLGCVQCRVAVAAEHEGLAAAPVAEVPPIAAARRAYRALGKDPSRYRLSSEALMRRVAQGKGLYRINTVVDTNNLVSLRTGLAVGAYRLERLAPPVTFRKGRPGESYPAIGRGPLNLENLPLFADREGPFGSPTSDSERTMITLDTEGLLMVLIAFGDEPGMADAARFATECLEAYCAAREVETALVTTLGD